MTVDSSPTGATLRTRGVRLIRLPRAASEVGSLIWGEHAAHLPFTPRRFFCIYGAPPDAVRGHHAHRRDEEVMICVRGRCTITLDDGEQRDEIVLDDPQWGLYVPPFTWSTQRYSVDALLFVLASEVYRPDDYIRDYAAFVALRAGRG